jgi:hypothetical protein
MTMRKTLTAVAVAAAAAVFAAAFAAAATGPTTTISSPSAGQKISLRHTPYLAVAGSATFADTSAGTSRFFLRRDGCGTASDNPHLSLTSGTDGGDGCGLIVNAVTGLGGDADQAAFIDFPASDGMPLAYDGTQPVDGQISLTGAQVGVAYVDVTLSALIGGNAVDIGSTTATAILDPTGASTPVPFTIQPNVSLDGSDIQALDLRVHIHGPNVYSGFIALSGASWVDVPSYAASVNEGVQISVDDPTFSSPIPARLSGTSWSVAIPTPSVGKHTIYAESTQGYDTSAPTSVTVTVTK